MNKPCGELRFTVKGTSMLPTLSPGDVVRVNPDRSPALHDLVCLQLPPLQETFIHRVVAVYRDKLLTCGDNRIFPDRIILKSNVLGVVEALENYSCSLGTPKKSFAFRILRLLLIKIKFFLNRLKK